MCTGQPGESGFDHSAGRGPPVNLDFHFNVVPIPILPMCTGQPSEARFDHSAGRGPPVKLHFQFNVVPIPILPMCSGQPGESGFDHPAGRGPSVNPNKTFSSMLFCICICICILYVVKPNYGFYTTGESAPLYWQCFRRADLKLY